MEKPAPPPEIRRICPACNRPVKPGYKFCESCGERIPELSTCSKCGTRFISPLKFCDLCGAPVILEKIPGPDDDEEPEQSEVEDQESYADESVESPEEENTGPFDDEVTEQTEDEILEPDREETHEPDTDELLEIYGQEYADDETLDSRTSPKSPSSLKQKTKKPATASASSGPGFGGNIDDALFLTPGMPTPVGPPVNKMKVIAGGVVLIIIIAAVYFIGLPLFTSYGDSTDHSSVTVADITNLPESAIINTTPSVGTPAPSGALVPQPTQLIPGDQTFFFQVQKNPVTAKITVTFTGSAGVDSINSADVTVFHPDGSVTTGIIMPRKGVPETVLTGSTGTDRVEIIVNMYNGKTYRVVDKLIPYRE